MSRFDAWEMKAIPNEAARCKHQKDGCCKNCLDSRRLGGRLVEHGTPVSSLVKKKRKKK